MRLSARVLAATIALALGAARVGSAGAATGEPAAVAVVVLPVEAALGAKTTPSREVPATITSPVPAAAATRVAAPAPAPAPVPAPAPARAAPPREPKARNSDGDNTSWGILVRGGYFGLPNSIADQLFTLHPEVTGSIVGAELRYHGNGGGRGIASIGFGIESATATATGEWQQSAGDTPKMVTGEIKMLAATVTGYWSIFPSWYLHPYIGIGIGVAHTVGSYKDEKELIEVDYWVPVVHVPIGLAIELGKYLQLSAEGRFIDGIAVNGALQVRF